MSQSVFSSQFEEAFPFRFNGTLHLDVIAGGVPSDPNVAEGWLRKKLGVSDEATIQKMVAETMVERGITAEEAASEVSKHRHLNGFKRDPDRGGELYVEGRQLKAGLKEAVSIAIAAGKVKDRGWGKTNKGLLNYFKEHVFIVEDRLYLGVTEPTGIMQRFVHTWRSSGIQYEEYVNDASVDFTAITDEDFSPKDWGMIWLTGEQNGLGASRSQGFGRYQVTRWEAVK